MTMENWLRQSAGWVDTKTICDMFQVTERELRADGDKDGLLTQCAISRQSAGGGYIHVANMSDDDWISFINRERNAALRRLVRLRDLKRKRRECLTKPLAAEWEKNGQGRLIA